MELDDLGEIITVHNEPSDVLQVDSDVGGNSDDAVKVRSSDVTDASGSLVGVVADKWEDLYELYKKHSQAIGFSIRKSGLRRTNVPGAPEFERYFVCSCEGQHANGKKSEASPSNYGQGKKNVKTRYFCKTNVRVQVNDKGVWEVLSHVLEHNHPLTPPEWQHHHRSERRITDAEGEFIEAMTEAMVPATMQYRIAAKTAGGDDLVGHTKRDHINFVRRLNMKTIEGGDASTLMTLLVSRQAEDPGFFFPSSVRYNLICGAFVGINNHWSNVLFGCAFLAKETQESFEWLFKVFDESMGPDTLPVSIFTDQDLAMKNAIEENAFNKCLNGCYSEIEFETTWSKMISEYGLQNNEWFKRLYGLKEKWSTALNKEYFSAEFVVAMGTRAEILSTEDSILLYGVDPPGVSHSTHHVTFDCVNTMVECSCRKFPEMGMLCFHIIRVFHIHSVTEIPNRYILRRWTKFAKKEVWSRILPTDMRRAIANGSLNWRRSVMTKLYHLIAKCQNEPDARAILDKLYTTANE
ncbi:protein FAR1-RELATED SEQUENCE 5-like [Silene latifolia]|uniref:protein FAR1-RELATED SEQUENCE 5-like n=1 Tax=Silene latifolia TaxID=37657 RepID=UPI003D787BAE